MKFRPGTDEGDYRIKLRNLTRFLEEGDKAKVTLRYRGREMAHQELGVRLIDRVKGDLAQYSTVEQYPKMEGRQLIMVLAPKKGKKPAAKTTVKATVQKKTAASAKEAAPKAAAVAAAGIEKK